MDVVRWNPADDIRAKPLSGSRRRSGYRILERARQLHRDEAPQQAHAHSRMLPGLDRRFLPVFEQPGCPGAIRLSLSRISI